MSKSIYAQIFEMIKQYQTIIIHRHMRPDPDAIGSQAGLAELLKASFPEKKILTAGETVGDLGFLAEMDKVEDADYSGALVIVTDTANTPRISDKRYSMGDALIKIDHHPNDDSYGDIVCVNTEASSCSEIIADFYLSHENQLALSNEAARLLYAGIIGDTGRFLYPSTTPKTMRIAAALMEYDFVPNEISNQLNTMPRKVAHLSGYVLQNLEISSTGVGKVVLTTDLMNEFGVTDTETAQIVSLPGTIDEVLVWGIFVEQSEGYFRCRLRSKGPVINEVAKRHNGGGHPLASGANAKDLNEVNQILSEFEDLAKDWEK
ncbi:MAG: bifunctional oligoribonuclease/PAP phosphatase NrnA [Desemzia incerta]